MYNKRFMFKLCVIISQHLLPNRTHNGQNPPPGVSIISKSWVFYKGWYLRLKFFIRRVNLVFYKKGVVFYKKLPFLIKNRWFRDFLHFGRGKKSDFSKCEWFYVNVIDPIFLYYNVFSCYMHNLLRLSFKIEFFIKSA